MQQRELGSAWLGPGVRTLYRDGHVPQPGIIPLGRVTGDVSIFDRPGPVTVQVERVD